MSKKQNWTMIICFLLLIFGFTAWSLFKRDTAFSEKENRDLQQMPKPDLQDILDGTFAADYETYLSDQFPMRDGWIGVKTFAERAAGKQEVNNIYFADDDYLIETHRAVFYGEQAQANIAYLADFVKTQREKKEGPDIKVLIAPNALDILEDKLPPFATAAEERAYLQQIREALPQGSFVDVQETLKDHAKEYLYYRTDHHWTTLGAWYAYETWAREAGLAYTPRGAYRREVLTQEFFGTVEAKVNTAVPGDTIEAWIPAEQTEYTVTYNHNAEGAKDTLYDRSFLDVRDKYAVFFGGNQPLTQIETKADSTRRLLVIKDSYANCFVPFAIQDFAQISMVDMRYFNERLSEYIQDNGFTDILFLYNAAGFAEDVSLAKLAL